MNGLDLFSGIGGIGLALREFGVRTIAYCEKDRYAQGVLLSRMQSGDIDRAPIYTDILKLKGNDLPVKIDIISGGFPCFVKDTMIFTKEGYKPIQDVVIGDEVLTHKRRWRRVTQVHKTENRETRIVKGTGILVTETTDEHPYYTRKAIRKWNNSKRNYDPRYFEDPTFIKAKDIKGLHVGMTYLPDEIEDTHTLDFWWLIGRCLADGWCVKRKNRVDGGCQKVVLCSRKHEDIREKIKKVFHSTFVKDSTANKYHITDKDFALLFSKAGIGARNKHIPNEWLALPQEKLKMLLDGYFYGDGSIYVSKSGRQGIRHTTVSKKLALTLHMAILKCYGVVPSIFYYEVPKNTIIEGRKVNRLPQYQIQFSNYNRSSYVDISEQYGWGICRKSERTNRLDTVYNIGVEDDESYIANGTVVHNCQDISVAGNGAGLEGERSGLFFEIIRLVKEIKPSFVFLENVPAIRTRGLSEVVNAFTEVGYDCRWTCLTAASVGACHKRERWFLLAHNRSKRVSGEFSKEIQGESSFQRCQNERGLAAPLGRPDLYSPQLCRTSDGVPFRMERLKCLGNSVVPLQVKTAFKRLLGLKGDNI